MSELLNNVCMCYSAMLEDAGHIALLRIAVGLYVMYGYEYKYNLLYCVLISDTARTYDPESDMTVVVGVPTYYSEKSRVMIRFSHIHINDNKLLIILCLLGQ